MANIINDVACVPYRNMTVGIRDMVQIRWTYDNEQFHLTDALVKKIEQVGGQFTLLVQYFKPEDGANVLTNETGKVPLDSVNCIYAR